MAAVSFEVEHHFAQPPRVVWDEMIDWRAHAEWIPATRVEIEPGDPTAPGARFTAWTGFGPLSLEDRMEVVTCDWDESASSGQCEVTKLGPVLRGSAGFSLWPSGTGTTLRWVEDVDVRWLPGLLAPIVTKLSALGFRQGLGRLGRLLDRREPATPGLTA